MHSRATGDSSSRTAPLPLVLRAVNGALALFILIGTLCVLQQYFGLGFTTDHEIVRADIRKVDDLYRWKLPEDYRGWLMNRRAWLYADGQPFLNRSISNRDLAELRNGWFHVRNGYLRFVPEDGSDPRRGRVRYSLNTPVQFEPEIWWLFGLSILVLLIVRTLLWNQLPPSASSHAPAPPASCAGRQGLLRETVLVTLLAAIIVTIQVVWGEPLTDSAFAIKDVPESDAAGWYFLADDLADGHGLRGGFQTQRPFYSCLLGSWFWLVGTSLATAKALNIALIAIAVGASWILGRLAGSRLIALGLTAQILATSIHPNYVHATITENAGLPFAITALLALWAAYHRASIGWAFVAGLVHSFGLLCSGVTLLATPFYALCLLLGPWWRDRAPRRGFRLAACFTLACCLVLVPWLLHQKIHNHHLTLSLNTAEVLAGAAHPEEGKLNRATMERAAAAGVNLRDASERYTYFQQEWQRLVQRDPLGYARRVARASLESLESLPTNEPGFRVTMLLSFLLIGLVPAIRRRHWCAFPLVVAMMVFWARAEFAITTPLLCIATVICLWRPPRDTRFLFILAFTTGASIMLLGGLSGNVAGKRCWIVGDWVATLLILSAVWHGVRLGSAWCQTRLARWRPLQQLGGATPRTPSRRPDASSVAIRLPTTVLLALVTFALIVIPTLTALGPHPHWIGLDTVPVQDITAEARLRSPFPLPPHSDDPTRCQSLLCRLDDLQLSFAAGEGTQHWLPQYEKRSYPHWVAHLRLLDATGQRQSGFAATGTGSLRGMPRAQPSIAYGISTYPPEHLALHPTFVLEILCIVPLRETPEGWVADWKRARWFEPAPHLLTPPPTP
ncbi:MAG: hypothetical protein KDK99_08775 [Verrucomicrobiales bacterium]|nr:hypothetical protein [Verrucomicrobiales bacterium]